LDVERIVIHFHHRRRDVWRSRWFLGHQRWFIELFRVVLWKTLTDIDPVAFVIDPTCCDSRRSVIFVCHRRLDVERIVIHFDHRRPALDHRRRDVWRSRWFLCHRVFAETPVVDSR